MPYDIIIGRDESDKKRFGKKGLVRLGKGYVKMGQYTSMSNDLYMDVARSHVILVAGKRGSGKSYTLGAIAEELSNLDVEERKNIAPLIFDTMGIFWTMKYENEKDKDLLSDWKLKPQKLPVKVFVPYGYYEEYRDRGIPVDEPFALNVSDLAAEDWALIFNLSFIDPVAVLIERIIFSLQDSDRDFDIGDITEAIRNDKESNDSERHAALGLFEGADTWGVFAKKENKETSIEDLLNPGTTTVIDLSVYNAVGVFNVRALVIGLLSRKIFNERMDSRKKEEIEAVRHGVDYLSYQTKRETPLAWIFIDECLTGDTEIITDKAHTHLKDIVSRFEKGEKFRVLGFDKKLNQYDHYDVNDVYSKGKRKVIKLTTETGREITCTPEHRVLTSLGFASAFSVDDIAFPLTQHYSTNKKRVEARILGHLFGDGWISDKTKSLGFSGKGNKDDLERIREDLSLLGFKSTNIFERKTKSKINHKGKINIVEGVSQSFQSSSAYRYFREKAGFAGEKVLTKISVPDYLFEASDLEKAEFLAALMGSDGQKISEAKNAKGDFNAIRFSFNKIESLEDEAIDYANQIRRLFNALGVEVSNIAKSEGNLRKDGNKTIKIVITLKKNLSNTIKFMENIGYRYCSYKELTGLQWMEYLKARKFLKEERQKIKEEALRLHSLGMGKIKIARKLQFPEAQIRDWIYNDMSPGLPKQFLSFSDWIEKRCKDNILFERIFRFEDHGLEDVYDISVDKVHNFVSNGLITHNCHEFLPKVGKTSATDALVQLLREGRQPGISLVLATQQPGQIHKDVMTQSDVVISHRLTAMPDVTALNDIMQTYLVSSIKKQLDDLPNLKGSALILDDNSERIYPMRVRPRFTWHGGEAPTAVKAEKKI